MKPILFTTVVALVLISAVAAERSRDSLSGFWRLSKSESNDNNRRKITGKAEMEFGDRGAYVFRYIDPKNGITNVQTFVGNFILLAPDGVAISLDGKTQERYRYRVTGGRLRMEHLDFPVTNTFTRINKFSLK